MHGQNARISRIFEPDSRNAGMMSMRFSCEPHGQNAGIVRILNDMHNQNAEFSGLFVNQPTIKILKSLGVFVTQRSKVKRGSPSGQWPIPTD